MVLILFLLLLASSFSLNNSLIIDIDGGFDDLIGVILSIIQDPQNVKAITIHPGSGYVQPTLWSVKKIIELFKPANTPEILVGYSQAEGPKPFPKEVADDSYTFARLPVWADEASLQDSSLLSSTQSALDVLKRVLQESSSAVDILVLGPTTNIAELLTQNPDLKSKINRVIIVGGTLKAQGNVEWKVDTPEWNIYNNPAAFKTVIESGVRITLIPLDVTKDISLQFSAPLLKKIERFAKQNKGKEYEIIHGILEAVKTRVEKEKNKIYFSDTLAAVYLLNPSLITTKPAFISVDSTGVIKETDVESSDISIEIAYQVERSVFHRSVIDILGKRPLQPKKPPLTPEERQRLKEQREKKAEERRLKRESRKKEQDL